MNRADIRRRECELWGNTLMLLVLWLFGRVIGDLGILYTGLSLEFIHFFWSLCGEAFADTLGKMIRVRNSKGQFKNVETIARISIFSQLIVGAVFTLLAFFLSEFFCVKVLNQHYCFTIIIILCPALFIRNISSYICGIIQGDGSNLPSAISYLIRPFLVCSFGFLFVNMLHNYGIKVSALLRQTEFSGMYGGIGIAIAVNVSEFFIFVYLLLIKLWRKRTFRGVESEGLRTVDPIGVLLRNLYSLSFFRGLIAMLGRLPILLSLIFLLNSLGELFTLDQVAVWYGSFFIILLFLSEFIYAFSAMPQCGGRHYLAKRDYKTSRMYLQTTLHIACVVAFWISSVCVSLSGPLAELISESNSKEIANLLIFGSFIVIVVSVSRHLTEFVLAAGSKLLVFICMLIKNIGLFFLLRLMVVKLSLGLVGVTNALIIAEIIYCIVIGIVLFAINRFYFDWGNMFLIPAIAAAVSGLLCVFLSRILGPHLEAGVTVIVSLVLSLMLYGMILMFTRNIRENELRIIPLGGVLGFFSRSFGRF